MSYQQARLGYYARHGHGMPFVGTELGCRSDCSGGPSRDQFHDYAESYEIDEDDDPSPPSVLPGMGEAPAACPARGHTTRKRCVSPQERPCPDVPDLVCVSGVRATPFEYVQRLVRDPVTGLFQMTPARPRSAYRAQVTPPVVRALEAFVDNMRIFGLPIEAILSMGSYTCRCISRTDHLSNHSRGDAFDVAGVRWRSDGPRPSRLSETIVENHIDAGERVLLRRINACLRLSFARVIDYHDSDHHDHFHCDMNRGQGRVLTEATTMRFVQESLEHVFNRPFLRTGRPDGPTLAGLREFGRLPAGAPLHGITLSSVLDSLFRFMASAGRAR
jgi:hypothetical protein